MVLPLHTSYEIFTPHPTISDTFNLERVALPQSMGKVVYRLTHCFQARE
jgi:hypothetical protein